MAKQGRKFAALLLTILLAGLLSGCFDGGATNGDTPQDDLGDLGIEGGTGGSDLVRLAMADDLFSVNSDLSAGFNPLSTKSSTNLLWLPLVYDYVFEVSNNFELSSRLITDYYTTDGGISWFFTVDNSVTFHDGTFLTAEDIAYSIRRAQQNGIFGYRLSSLMGVSAYDDETLGITLNRKNMQFPMMMTIPVIKYGSMDEAAPPGTGPYMFHESLTKLVAYRDHPYAGDLPADEIYLKEYLTAEDTIEAYNTGRIDIVVNNPAGMYNFGYGGQNEMRYYTTTCMHYIGFNAESDFFRFTNHRFAINYMVDRGYIAGEVLGGVAATIPMSPNSPLYNKTFDSGYQYSLEKAETVLNNIGVQDYDEDGLREYMSGGAHYKMSLDFIVCSDNALKVTAANRIADDLRGLGIEVSVRALSWKDFMQALELGDFDMYYASVKLTCDFDLTGLITKNGSLNYGKFDDAGYETCIEEYLAAADEDRQYYAEFMYKYIVETAPIVTVGFENRQVITHRGVATEIVPNQDNIFSNIQNWTIDFG